MQGELRVDYHELYALHDRLKSIAEGFAEVDDKSDYPEAVFGDRKIVDALTKFSNNWSDGRGKIYDSVNSLKDAVWATAKQYEDVDKGLASSIRGDGHGSAPDTSSGSSGGGGTAGHSAAGNRPDIPDGPGGAGVGPPAPFVGGPATTPGDGPRPELPPLAPLPFLPMVAPWLGTNDPRRLDGPEGGGPGGDKVRHLLDDADEYERRAAALPPGHERDQLHERSEALRREADHLRQIEERDDLHLSVCEPDKGRFIAVVGDGGEGGRVVIVVGEPGGCECFHDTLGHTDALRTELGAGAGTHVVAWQDYGTAEGRAPAAGAVVPQGAANLRGLVGQLQSSGAAPGGVALVGDGVGAGVIDHAMATPMHGVSAITPATLGEVPAVGAPVAIGPSEPVTGGAAPLAEAPPAQPAVSPPSAAGHGSSSNAMFAVMALGSMGQSLFFRGGGLRKAARKAVEDDGPTTNPVSSW